MVALPLAQLVQTGSGSVGRVTHRPAPVPHERRNLPRWGDYKEYIALFCTYPPWYQGRVTGTRSSLSGNGGNGFNCAVQLGENFCREFFERGLVHEFEWV